MKIRIVKEGYPHILLSFFIGLVLVVFNIYLGLLCFALCVFITCFFRDPVRVSPEEDGIILSPADGLVVDIRDIKDDTLLKKDARRVSIFMSIFNVHVNYAPIDGVVKYIQYKKGQFKAAFVDEASELNESNTVCVENGKTAVILKQIAGLIARRIVCDPKVGDCVVSGKRYGLIKFGSRVEITFDSTYNIAVKKGDKVKGALTILGVRRASGE
ncbi:MAG: phosphatidylserine decarboxylase family protein [Candidatus Ancaeobacter aquaticus]|nr:phosphatidylserine decarboxylase family protein [Candidatus Ancaeobacter aquaticus]